MTCAGNAPHARQGQASGQQAAAFPLSTSLASGILDSLAEPLLVLDPVPRVRYANRAFYRLFGLTRSDCRGRPLAELCSHWDKDAVRRLLEQALSDGQAQACLALERPGGAEVPRTIELRAERLPQAGSSALLLALPPRREAGTAEAEAASAAEKAAADRNLRLSLREIHHRVKNNVAAIGAFARLEAAQGDPSARPSLERISARIESFSVVYELLSTAEEHDSIELSRYLARLCEGLGNISECALNGSRIELTGDEVEVSVDHAVALGICVNELVTNAIRHAFPEGSGGRIIVSLEPGVDAIRLVVADDGRGPGPEAIGHAPGLGLQLVRTYVEQLGGTLSCEAGGAAGGTRQVIELPPGLAI